MTAQQLHRPTLITLIGVPGSGKSTFAAARYATTQIVSLDRLRGILCDNEADQTATDHALMLRRQILAERCRRRLDTVADSTSLIPEHRADLVMYGRQYEMLNVAVVFETPFAVCKLRRPPPFPAEVLERMWQQFQDHVPADGPVPGFDVTRRISPGRDDLYGTVPARDEVEMWAK